MMGFDPEFSGELQEKPARKPASAILLAVLSSLALPSVAMILPILVALGVFDSTSGSRETSSYHLLVNRETGQCLDVPFGSLESRTPVEQCSVNGGGNQAWSLDPAAGDVLRIVNRQSGQCLDIPFGMKDAGVAVEQFPVNGGANQGWRLVPAGDHWYRIENDWTKLCLEVPGGSAEKRTVIRQAECDGGFQQHWRAIAVK